MDKQVLPYLHIFNIAAIKYILTRGYADLSYAADSKDQPNKPYVPCGRPPLI
jgi:hypothetical protein